MQEEQQEKEKPLLSVKDFILMLVVALFFDGVLALIQLIVVVGSVAASVFNVVPVMLFFIWFLLKGISFAKKKNSLGGSRAAHNLVQHCGGHAQQTATSPASWYSRAGGAFRPSALVPDGPDSAGNEPRAVYPHSRACFGRLSDVPLYAFVSSVCFGAGP